MRLTARGGNFWSIHPVAAAEWPEDLRSELVAHESPESVDPLGGSRTPDSDYWRTLETAIVGTLTLLVQPKPLIFRRCGTSSGTHHLWLQVALEM